jgi:ComF family protein
MAFLAAAMEAEGRRTLSIAAALSTVRTVGRMAVDAVLPPRCLSCGTIVDMAGALCPDCFNGFTFIAQPFCRICGISLQAAVPEEPVCGACLRERPDYNRARAVFVYNAASKSLLLKLKHGDRTDAAVHLSRWMQRAGAELLDACDVIVPVPLHRWRLLWRSYNQAALLANALGKIAGKPVVPDALARIKATPSQGRLDRQSRRRNVARAFAVTRGPMIAGKRVLLIDDVLTSGATAEACTRALLAGGAQQVDVLVLGRVPTPGT